MQSRMREPLLPGGKSVRSLNFESTEGSNTDEQPGGASWAETWPFASFCLLIVVHILGTTGIYWHGDGSVFLFPSQEAFRFDTVQIDLWLIGNVCLFVVLGCAVVGYRTSLHVRCLRNSLLGLTLSACCVVVAFSAAKTIACAASADSTVWHWLLPNLHFFLATGEGVWLWQLISNKHSDDVARRGGALDWREELQENMERTRDRLQRRTARERLRARLEEKRRKKAEEDGTTTTDPLTGGDEYLEADEEEERAGVMRRMKRAGANMSRLAGLAWPDRWFIVGGFISLLLAAASSVFIPHFMGTIVEKIAIQHDHKAFIDAVILLVVTSVVSGIFTGLRGVLLMTTLARLRRRLRDFLFRSILRQELGWFDSTLTGEITSRLSADTTKVGDQISLNLNVFLRSLIQFIGTLIFMCFISWQLTLVTFITLPPVIVVSKVYGHVLQRLSRQTQDAIADCNSVADETIAAIATVRSFAAEHEECDRHGEHLNEFYGFMVTQARAYGFYAAVFSLLPNLVTATILWVGGQLVLNGSLTGGKLVSFLLYQMSLSSSFSTMGDVFTGMMTAVGAAEKVFAMIDRVPTIKDDGTLRLPQSGSSPVPASPGEPVRGDLELRNVTFAYPTRADMPVLKGLSLAVPAGNVVALVGPSGGGKSSIVRLIERFYVPSEGTVMLDGRTLGEYDRRWRHRIIAMVGQEPVLFARTIYENIVYGLEEEEEAGEVTVDDVEQAARLANAHDFIMSFKDGYDTFCGEKGVSLSGGQKQRVAIARALVRRPAVLLLDEATSALDAESEQLVQDAIDRVMRQRRLTVLVIAHRLSTVKNADRIAVIYGGEVAEEGTHESLLRAGGMYAALVRHQLEPANE